MWPCNLVAVLLSIDGTLPCCAAVPRKSGNVPRPEEVVGAPIITCETPVGGTIGGDTVTPGGAADKEILRTCGRTAIRYHVRCILISAP